MDITAINVVAVAAAAVASFAFGAAWYMTLSGPWMAAVGKTEDDLKRQSSPLPYILAMLCQLVMAAALAWLGTALGRMDLTGMVTLAAVLWLGFVLTTQAVNHGFQGAPRMLTLIDGGHWLGVMAVQAVVLALVTGWMG